MLKVKNFKLTTEKRLDTNETNVAAQVDVFNTSYRKTELDVKVTVDPEDACITVAPQTVTDGGGNVGPRKSKTFHFRITTTKCSRGYKKFFFTPRCSAYIAPTDTKRIYCWKD